MTEKPISVVVAGPVPIPVVMTGGRAPEVDAPPNTTAEEDRQSLGVRLLSAVSPPKTTSEEDRKSAGQRRVNIIWEGTQAVIAVSVIGTTLFVDGYVAMYGGELAAVQSSALMQLNVMAALVTGFYFGRTNHQRTGGVGGMDAGPR